MKSNSKTNKNILFLWPPSAFLCESMFKHFTFFGETIGYISKTSDFNISVIDATVTRSRRPQLISAFRKNDVLIIYIEHYNVESAISMINMAKACNPEIKIMAVGTACCYYPKFIFGYSQVDVVLNNGEWEIGISDYLKYLFYNKSISEMNKMILKVDGKLIETRLMNLLPGDKWSQPNFDLLPLAEYLEINNGQMEILVNRGCPYNCLFCVEKYVYGYNFRTRSVDSVVEYMKKYRKIASIFYLDATTFTYNRDWVVELCNKLVSLSYEIPWRSDTRIDCLNEDLIKLMAQAGCQKLSLGVETLDGEIQQYIKKPIEINKIRSTYKLLNKYGIKPRSLLIAGLPNQTKKNLLSTVKTLKAWGSEIRLKEYYPYQDLLKENLTMDDIRKFNRSFFNNRVKGMTITEYVDLIYPEKN